MPSEASGGEVRPNVAQVVSEDFGALGGCFVDGDAEQRQRERRVRRRSLVLSVSLQIVVLAAILLLPLFGKPERIALAAYVPIPPYSRYVQHRSQPAGPTHSAGPRRPCIVCFHNLPPHPATTDGRISRNDDNPDPGEFIGLMAPNSANQIPLSDNRQPQVPAQQPSNPKVVHVTHLDPAMLVRRVEPIYPVLPRQIRKEGQVQLHAIISTDGSIQSLQYAGGDMMFFESARDAVLQWRYRPTVLNGQPVEVDTTITVIYTLAH